MSLALTELIQYCDQFLDSKRIRDYCPNGLQVEGCNEVAKIVTGVTASQALIDQAVALNADAILVHHGYFWKGERAEITGLKKARIKSLLTHDISLIAYHLPLDLHPQVGNNAQLASLLGLELAGPLEPDAKPSVGQAGKLVSPMLAGEFAEKIGQVLGRECQHIGDPSAKIETIGWCTGAAQGMIEHAANQGLDAYLSGEISEPTVHIARETGVHYFSAGHHATERYGVKALGEHLNEKFGVDCQFIDIDNPV